MDCGMPGFPVFHSLPEFVQTNVHWVIDAFQCLILYGLLFLLPSIFLNISVDFLHQMAKVLKLQISISPSNELSGMVSLRINWFDPVAVQRTLKSLLQHHTLKASVLWCSAFFMVQLSHPYVTTGKIIALTVWTFVSKLMSLLLNTLTRFVITSSISKGN